MLKKSKNKMAKPSKEKTAKKKDVKVKDIEPEIKSDKIETASDNATSVQQTIVIPKVVAIQKTLCQNCGRPVPTNTIFFCPKCGKNGCIKCGWDKRKGRCPSCGYTKF